MEAGWPHLGSLKGARKDAFRSAIKPKRYRRLAQLFQVALYIKKLLASHILSAEGA